MSSLPNEMPALNASRKPIVMIWSQKITDLFLTAVTVDAVDDLLHFLLPQKAVHQLERCLRIQRQKRAQLDATRRRVETCEDFLAFVVDLLDAGP